MQKITAGKVLFILMMFGLGGCENEVTGGGRILGGNGAPATFGFNANSCESEITGHINLVDNDAKFGPNEAGVRLSAEVTSASLGDCAEGAGTLITADYVPTNPKVAFEPGELTACVVDGDPDRVELTVTSGVYTGYSIIGDLKGNVTSHGCEGDG